MKKLVSALLVAFTLFAVSVPVMAADGTVMGGGSFSTGESAGGSFQVDSDSLNGADDVVNSADGVINGYSDNMPEQSPGLLAFLATSQFSYPSWFIWAIDLSLCLSLVLLLIRFLWR